MTKTWPLNVLAWLLLLVAIVGCAEVGAALGAKPDPRAAENAADMAYFASKDTDPADAQRAAAAILRAKTLAEEAGKIDDLQRRLDEIQKNAAGSGTPIGQTIATGIGILGFLLTAGKTAYRTFKGQPSPGTDPAPAAPPVA